MTTDLVISLAFVCFLAIGFIFGNLYGRGQQWREYRQIKKSYENEISLWRTLYLTAEKHKQEFIKQFCWERNWKVPKFESPLQSEIDFEEDSPTFEGE